MNKSTLTFLKSQLAKNSYNEDDYNTRTVLFSKVYNARKTFTWPVKERNTETMGE